MKSLHTQSPIGSSALSLPSDGAGWTVSVAIYLVLCVILGGGAVAGYLGDFVLQLLAIPILLAGLWQMQNIGSEQRRALLFCGALVLVPVIQLIPLPPVLWTRLPLRDVAVEALTLSNQDLGWRPISLTPHATWLALGSLIPPLAVLVASLRLSYQDRRLVVVALLAVGVMVGFIGLLQVALGPSAHAFDIGPASPGEATGFFANRNHFSALLYVLLLFAAVWAIDSASALPGRNMGNSNPASLIRTVAFFTLVVVFLAAQLMARSRAGLGLTILSLFGIAALAASGLHPAPGRKLGGTRLMGAAVSVAVLFGAQFALYRAMERFAADPLQDARVIFARNTWQAAISFLPFGSGLGSFVPVYQFFEKPRDALLDTYVNRAHNEFLEVTLETGVVGVLLIVLFAGWLMRRVWRVWRTPIESADGPVDTLLARAASLGVILLAAHSLVDYPLRTTALMCVSAFACALLIAPRLPNGPGGTRAGTHSAVNDAVGPSSRAEPARTVAQSQRGINNAGTHSVDESGENWNWPEVMPAATSKEKPAAKPQSGALWDENWPEAWREGASELAPKDQKTPGNTK